MRRSHRVCAWRRGDRQEAGRLRTVLVLACGMGLSLPASWLTPDLMAQQTSKSGVHEVQRGDTLWDLARRFLTNPFLWPQIYQLNSQVVEDPHWIYPGEILRLPSAASQDATQLSQGAVTGVQVQVQTSPPAVSRPVRQEQQGRQGVSGFGGSSIFDRSPSSGDVLGSLGVEDIAPPPLVSSGDFHRAAYLADPVTLGTLAVTARRIGGNPLKLSLPPAVRPHDRVMVSLNGLTVEVGESLQAVQWKHKVRAHGRVVRPVALLEVTSVQGDSARAQVLEVYGNYHVGDPLLPLETFDFDGAWQRVPAESALVADVVGLDVKQVLLGPGDQVFLDAGSESGLRIGDEFAVFSARESHPATAAIEDRLAVVRVVRLRPNTATAMVVEVNDAGAGLGSPARLAYRASGG